MSEIIQPVLLGADLNCYSMARAFFAACGRPSVVYGQAELGAVRYSRYVRFYRVEGLGRKEVLLPLLQQRAATRPQGMKEILLPCTDEYARLLIEESERLSRSYLLPLPPKDALPLFDKDRFYAACERHGVPYPKTITLTHMPTLADVTAAGEELGFPFIIKPARSDSYWQHPFAGMEKVYLVHNKHAAECVLSEIFASGYPQPVLLQRYIPGGDRVGYVLTVYIDRQGKTTLRACGRVLLEERTPRGKGNYAALVSAAIPPVAEALCRLLASFSYRGFANFDLRRDRRDGRFYALEVNLRLGRSNYFLTAGGQNPAAWILRDHMGHAPLLPTDMKGLFLFRTVPFSTVWQYTAGQEDAALARALHQAGREACPLYDRGDMLHDVRRALYVAVHMQREKQKFSHYGIRRR